MVLCLPRGRICSALRCGDKPGRQCADDVARLFPLEEGDALFLSFAKKVINNGSFTLQNFNNRLYPGASPSVTLAELAFFFLYIFLGAGDFQCRRWKTYLEIYHPSFLSSCGIGVTVLRLLIDGALAFLSSLAQPVSALEGPTGHGVLDMEPPNLQVQTAKT